MKKVRLFESFIGEASRGKIHKAVKAGDYPATIVVIEDGDVVHQETVNTPEAVPASFNVLQKEYPKAKLHVEDKGGQTLFVEGLEVNESYSLQHGGGEFKQMDRRVNDADKIGVGNALAKIWNSLGVADGDFDHEQAWAYVVSFMDGSSKFRRLLESFNSTDDSEVNESNIMNSYYFTSPAEFGQFSSDAPAKDETKYLVMATNKADFNGQTIRLEGAIRMGSSTSKSIIGVYDDEQSARDAYKAAMKKPEGTMVSFTMGTVVGETKFRSQYTEIEGYLAKVKVK